MRIGLLGLGAIGNVMAKYLVPLYAKDMVYFSRTPKDYIKVLFNENHFIHEIKCEDSVDNQMSLDWLIICIKEHQYEQACYTIQNLTDKYTKIALIRNGINLKESVENCTASSEIVEVIIDCSVQFDGSTYIQLSKPKVICDRTDLGESFAKLVSGTGIQVILSKNFNYDLWAKLILSSAMGAVMILTEKNALTFRKKENVKLFESFISEGMMVAESVGVSFGANYLEDCMSYVSNLPEEKTTSLKADYDLRLPLELGAKSEAIVQAARRLGVLTPHHSSFVMKMKQLGLFY